MPPNDFGVPGGMKLGYKDLPQMEHREAEHVESMAKGVRHLELLIRIEAVLSIAAGSADGTLRTDGMARLIERLQILLGDVVIADLNGLQILELTKRHAEQGPVVDQPSGAGTSVTSEALTAELILPFSPAWLANPFECHLGPVGVNERLEARLTFAHGSGAGSGASDPGTEALISGGDRNVTWDAGEAPTATLTQVTAPTGPAAVFVPMWRVYHGENFSAPDTAYRIPIQTRRPIGHMVLAAYDAANGGRDPKDLVERVTVGDRADFNRQRAASLEQRERRQFPAVPSTDVGKTGILFADNGKSSNRLVPERDLEQDALELEVADPSGGSTPARVEAIATHLVQEKGITRGTYRRGPARAAG